MHNYVYLFIRSDGLFPASLYVLCTEGQFILCFFVSDIFALNFEVTANKLHFHFFLLILSLIWLLQI